MLTAMYLLQEISLSIYQTSATSSLQEADRRWRR